MRVAPEQQQLALAAIDAPGLKARALPGLEEAAALAVSPLVVERRRAQLLELDRDASGKPAAEQDGEPSRAGRRERAREQPRPQRAAGGEAAERQLDEPVRRVGEDDADADDRDRRRGRERRPPLHAREDEQREVPEVERVADLPDQDEGRGREQRAG